MNYKLKSICLQKKCQNIWYFCFKATEKLNKKKINKLQKFLVKQILHFKFFSSIKIILVAQKWNIWKENKNPSRIKRILAQFVFIAVTKKK